MSPGLLQRSRQSLRLVSRPLTDASPSDVKNPVLTRNPKTPPLTPSASEGRNGGVFFSGFRLRPDFSWCANNPTPPPRPKAGSEEALLKVSTKAAAMIATNFLKYPEAQIVQMELDLAGVIGAPEAQRSAWWAWLMKTAAHTKALTTTAPQWLVGMRVRARALAASVRARLMTLW